MNYDSLTQSQKVLSLCAGYCGIERGISKYTRLKTVAYVEIEAFAIQNLANAMKAKALDQAPIFTDVKTFDGKSFYNRVHGIIGGYPCQPFSVAGLRKGKEDPRHLWPYILELISTIRPIWCFFENVPGHINQGLEEVMQGLRNLGYAVESRIFSAEEVGAPHKRKRIFIFAHSKSDEYRIELANPNSQHLHMDKPSEWNENAHALRTSKKGDTKLGNAHDEGIRGEKDEGEKREFERGKPFVSSQELADPNELGFTRRNTEPTPEEREKTQSIEDCSKLSNTDSSRGRQNTEPSELWAKSTKQPCNRRDSEKTKEIQTQWPARPEQAQHEWEEPRQIGARLRLPTSLRKLWKRFRTNLTKEMGEGERKEIDWNVRKATEPCLGGPAYGNEHRSDLLRMLGNGVVPQAAAKAWYELNLKMRKNFDI